MVLQGVDVGRIAHVVSNRAEMAEERRQRREHMRERLYQSNAEDLLELLLRISQRHPSHVLYILDLSSANQDAGQPTSAQTEHLQLGADVHFAGKCPQA